MIVVIWYRWVDIVVRNSRLVIVVVSDGLVVVVVLRVDRLL